MESKFINKAAGIILITVFSVIMFSCVDTMDPDKTYKVSDGYLIDEYLAGNPDLHLAYELVENSTYSGMIHGYGSYTFFVPNDEALQRYLTENDKTDISDLTKAQCDSLLRFHIIRDSVKTEDFVDGKMPSPTISGIYLTSRVVSDANADTWYEVNRQSRITQANISCDNGIIHVIDTVLKEPSLTVMEMVEQNYPDSLFSISKHLIRKYCDLFADSLKNDSTKYTLFMQDNSSFIDMGIGISQNLIDSAVTYSSAYDSIESCLLKRLKKNQPNETDNNVLLTDYVDYHFIPQIKYISDLLFLSALTSSVENQAISFKLDGTMLFVNYFKLGNTIEPGVELYRTSDYSDVTCTNGVVHYIAGQIEIKQRSAYRVYWDMAEQPEITSLKGFRKNGTSVEFDTSSLAGVRWGGTKVSPIWYSCNGSNTSTSLLEKEQRAYGDMMRFRFSPGHNSWFEWDLPILVKGKYKVWICWRREQTTTFRTIFRQEGKDDQVMPYVFDLGAYGMITYKNGRLSSPVYSKEEILAAGQKQYNAKLPSSVINCCLLGTINVESTGAHMLRFECLTGRSGETSWDMIQFIPVDEDQWWPQVDNRGNWIYSNTTDCEIWPYNVNVQCNYMADTCERP